MSDRAQTGAPPIPNPQAIEPGKRYGWLRVIAPRRDGRWRVLAECCGVEHAYSGYWLQRHAATGEHLCVRCRERLSARGVRYYGLRLQRVVRKDWWPLAGWGERG